MRSCVRYRNTGNASFDLDEKMVLSDVESGVGLALPAHSRAHDLGETIVVRGSDMQARLDLLATRAGARLTTEQADAQRQR